MYISHMISQYATNKMYVSHMISQYGIATYKDVGLAPDITIRDL